jgi:hypothetical protein
MKRILMISLVPAMLLVLAAMVLVIRDTGGDGGGRHDTSAAERSVTIAAPRARPGPTSTTPPTTTTATNAPTPATPAPAEAPATTAPAPAEAPADGPHFVCPDGGMDAVVALQQAWEDGHQPWLGSAPDVAAACTFGVPESLVEPVGPNRYQVTHTTANTGESAIVELAQPLGPGTVWVAVEIAYATSGVPHAPCTEAAILPVVAGELEAAAGGALHFVAVELQQCRNGYARVFAVPDNSGCGHPGGACVETEQVFLADHAGQWRHLTSGTGIACEADDDLFPALLAACQALGLRP